jgi:hypothetical protein
MNQWILGYCLTIKPEVENLVSLSLSCKEKYAEVQGEGTFFIVF